MNLLEQWRKTEQAIISVTDGETVQDYRFTFGTMSAFSEAKHQAIRQQNFRLLDELIGSEWRQPEATDEDRTEFSILLDIFIKHAGIIAACESVDIREYADGTSEDEISALGWTGTGFPDLWKDAKQVADNIPMHTLNYLFETVILAGNPARMFGFGSIDDEEKKIIRVSTSPSESLPKPSPKPKKRQKPETTTSS